MEPTAPTAPRTADILIVDDTRENLDVLAEMLRACGYKVRPVTNGPAALRAAAGEPPDLVLLDVSMPGMDGFEVCARLKADASLGSVPVLFVSALADVEGKVRAFRAGGVDYVTKPFRFEEVQARIDTHLRLSRLQRSLEREVRRQVAEIGDAQMAMIYSLARMTELRDDATGKHVERVQTFCGLLAEGLAGRPGYEAATPEFRRLLESAGPLHDIGKVAIPDRILLKPGPLDPDEMAVMRTHAEIGAAHLAEVLQRYPGNAFLRMGISVARSHHERWDGTGYPDGLAGGTIPLSARIMALADLYDALRSRRVYKEPMSHEACLEVVRASSGRHIDPVLCAVLLEREADFAVAYRRLTDVA